MRPPPAASSCRSSSGCSAPSLGVILCDLKPENILLDEDEDYRTVLADLGMARIRAQMPSRKGTESYEAPEVQLRATPDNADKIDVWALGICLHLLVLGFNPFQDQNYRAHVLHQLKRRCRTSRAARGVRGVRHGARFDTLPDDLAALLDGSQYDPTRRFTLDQVAALGAVGATAAAAEATAEALVAGRPPPSRPPRAAHAAAASHTRSYHGSGRPETAPAAVTASYRSMAAARTTKPRCRAAAAHRTAVWRPPPTRRKPR